MRGARLLPAAALLGLAAAAPAQTLDPALRAFVEAVVATRERYVVPGDAARPERVQAAIKAFLGSFGDPATRYLSPGEWKGLERSARGKFQGYGMLIAQAEGGFLLERVYAGSPAERAGLQDGDLLLSVNGRRRLPADLSALRELLHEDPAGARVRVRRGERILRAELHRGQVHLPSIEDTRLPGNVHYVRLRSFTERGPEELRAVLVRALDARDLILDLRGNTGGVLDAAVAMHGSLAGPGEVTWVVGRDGVRQPRRARATPVLPSPPALVLVDRDTASAAEVLAASLRRAGSLLVGEATYGKGTVQEVTPLSDGGAAVLTVARYEIAPGVPLPASGLVPDRALPHVAQGELAFPPDLRSDPGLRGALHLLQGARGD